MSYTVQPLGKTTTRLPYARDLHRASNDDYFRKHFGRELTPRDHYIQYDDVSGLTQAGLFDDKVTAQLIRLIRGKESLSQFVGEFLVDSSRTVNDFGSELSKQEEHGQLDGLSLRRVDISLVLNTLREQLNPR